MGINMHIFVKNTSGYNAVSVEDGSMKIDLGLFDKDEALSLAKDLILAAEELLPLEYDFAERALQTVREAL
jgi:hypothetical protein